MSRRMMCFALKREELVDRRDGRWIRTPKPYLRPPGAVQHLVADRGSARRHHSGAWHNSGMDSKGFRKVSPAKVCDNALHVAANRGGPRRVARVVALEENAPPVRQILEDMGGGVLIDAHYDLAARLRCRERTIAARADLRIRRPAAGADHQDRGQEQARETSTVLVHTWQPATGTGGARPPIPSSNRGTQRR